MVLLFSIHCGILMVRYDIHMEYKWKFWSDNLKRDLGVHGRMILKMIWIRYGGKALVNMVMVL